MINIDDFGIYKDVMTRNEIETYLIVRFNEKSSKTQESIYLNRKKLIHKFVKIAGANTQIGVTCSYCKKLIRLMYRYDVERFANQLFNGTLTYFD